MSQFGLYTDGSGLELDGFGGWACLVIAPDGRRIINTGGSTGTTVDRMEFTALLEGLESILKLWDDPLFNRADDSIVVHWHSDRESLVKSAQAIYGRKSAHDLWLRFDHYAEKMQIFPNHVRIEDEGEEFKTVDLHASAMRIVIKNYAEAVS